MQITRIYSTLYEVTGSTNPMYTATSYLSEATRADMRQIFSSSTVLTADRSRPGHCERKSRLTKLKYNLTAGCIFAGCISTGLASSIGVGLPQVLSNSPELVVGPTRLRMTSRWEWREDITGDYSSVTIQKNDDAW